jgi:hypothetical protein
MLGIEILTESHGEPFVDQFEPNVHCLVLLLGVPGN